MRTKTLLIAAAAALAAGIVTSQAQVYSQNIVGYVNKTLPNGYSIVDAPLSPDSTNDVQSEFPALTPGDVLLFWNGGGYTTYYYSGPGQWYDGIAFTPVSAPTLAPGQAIFYQNNSGGPETNTFVGTVQLTNTVSLNGGYSLIGSTPPVADTFDGTNLNLPLVAGDVIYRYNGGGYTTYYYGGPGAWYDGINFTPVSEPVIPVSEGFFYQNNSGGNETWTQNVVVQ
jgi:hypothetical protein